MRLRLREFLQHYSRRAFRFVFLLAILTSLLVGMLATYYYVQKRDEALLEGNRAYLYQLLKTNDAIEVARHLNSFVTAGLIRDFRVEDVRRSRIVAEGGHHFKDNSEISVGSFRIGLNGLIWTRTQLFDVDSEGDGDVILHASFEVPSGFLISSVVGGFLWSAFCILVFLRLGRLSLARLERNIETMRKRIFLLSNKDFGIRTSYSLEYLDIVELSETLSDFQSVYKQLQDSETEKGIALRSAAVAELARQLIHDIRSPISALSMLIFELRDREPESFQLLKKSFERVEEIVRDLELRTKQEQTIAENSKFHAVVQAVFNSLIDLTNEKKLEYKNVVNLTFKVVDELTSESKQKQVVVDLPIFRRIVSNLLNNSVEALRSQENPEIELKIKNVPDGMLMVSIADNGPGIPKEILGLIGQKGFSYGKSGGAGRGLWYAKTNLELWKAKVNIESSSAGCRVEMLLKVL